MNDATGTDWIVGAQQRFDKRHGGGERREDPREREREQKAERNA